jgi:hypothetical protein
MPASKLSWTRVIRGHSKDVFCECQKHALLRKSLNFALVFSENDVLIRRIEWNNHHEVEKRCLTVLPAPEPNQSPLHYCCLGA